MKVDYLGNVPLNLTLDSGNSFYAKPKQTDLEISEQDWLMTKRLSILKKKNLFRVVDETDKFESVQKKSVKAEDLVLEPSQPRYEQQPETFDFNSKGELVGARPLTVEEKKDKIYRKKVKIQELGKVNR